MACRRRRYQDATHDELKNGSDLVDARHATDDEMLASEEQRKLAGSRIYLQRLRVLMSLSILPAEDAELVRRVLCGADWFELDHAAQVRLGRAGRKLRRALAPSGRVAQIVGA